MIKLNEFILKNNIYWANNNNNLKNSWIWWNKNNLE